MEADFQRFYHLDLGGLWRGEFTPRRAATLAVQLPAGAQTWHSAGVDSAWTLGEHLTASVFDALNIANWQRGGDSSAKRPTPVKRPSDVVADDLRSERMEAKARAFLARQQARQQPNEET